MTSAIAHFLSSIVTTTAALVEAFFSSHVGDYEYSLASMPLQRLLPLPKFYFLPLPCTQMHPL